MRFTYLQSGKKRLKSPDSLALLPSCYRYEVDLRFVVRFRPRLPCASKHLKRTASPTLPIESFGSFTIDNDTYR